MRSLLMRDFTINQRDVFTIILFNLFSCRLVSWPALLGPRVLPAQSQSPSQSQSSSPSSSSRPLLCGLCVLSGPRSLCVDCYYLYGFGIGIGTGYGYGYWPPKGAQAFMLLSATMKPFFVTSTANVFAKYAKHQKNSPGQPTWWQLRVAVASCQLLLPFCYYCT